MADRPTRCQYARPGAPAAIAAAEGLLAEAFLRQTSIGGIIPDVSIDETHTDELTITENPVEREFYESRARSSRERVSSSR